MILALLGEAVFTAQITVMGHMKTQRLYHGLPALEILHILLIYVLGKQYTVLLQLLDLLQGFSDILCGIRSLQSRNDCVCTVLVIHGNGIIYHIVNHMDRAAAHIHYDVVAIIFILVNQLFTPLCCLIVCLIRVMSAAVVLRRCTQFARPGFLFPKPNERHSASAKCPSYMPDRQLCIAAPHNPATRCHSNLTYL